MFMLSYVLDDNKGGIAFKCIHEDDLRRLGVSAAGLSTISRLKERIGKYQSSIRVAIPRLLDGKESLYQKLIPLKFH